MKPKKTFYYKDLINDDFAGTKINTSDIEEDFVFVNNNLIWRILSFIIYYFIAIPLVYIFCKLVYHVKIHKPKGFKKLKGGYFLYANHTGFYDAFTTNLVNFPKRSYIIANRDVVSIKGIRNIVMLLGAIPIPCNNRTMIKFLEAIEKRYNQKKCIVIFPEAHIWPYYNKIRPFKPTSFRYPIKLNAPCVAMCTTYRKRKGLFKNGHPYIDVYVSEPFYPNLELSSKEAQLDLRNRIYKWLDECASNNENVEYYKYIAIENKEPSSM
ncbi:MAG TPA: lysophospholipid acyltransferase family protein [Haloplasmataceae bacterium]